MQPSCAGARPGEMTRLLVACALALGLLSLPTAQVRACSCAALGGPADVVASADLAFIGTVVGSAPGGDAPAGLGPTVRYAFAVERASVPIDGEIVEVHALDDAGGMCGFAFGEGERWFVAAHQEEGSLQTNLCSGNVRMDAMADADLAGLVEVLPAEPGVDHTESQAVEDVPVPILVAAAALITLVGVAFLAFRRGDRPTA